MLYPLSYEGAPGYCRPGCRETAIRWRHADIRMLSGVRAPAMSARRQVAHPMQVRALGRASSRSAGIRFPHCSQIPYRPSWRS